MCLSVRAINDDDDEALDLAKIRLGIRIREAVSKTIEEMKLDKLNLEIPEVLSKYRAEEQYIIDLQELLERFPDSWKSYILY